MATLAGVRRSRVKCEDRLARCQYPATEWDSKFDLQLQKEGLRGGTTGERGTEEERNRGKERDRYIIIQRVFWFTGSQETCVKKLARKLFEPLRSTRKHADVNFQRSTTHPPPPPRPPSTSLSTPSTATFFLTTAPTLLPKALSEKPRPQSAETSYRKNRRAEKRAKKARGGSSKRPKPIAAKQVSQYFHECLLGPKDHRREQLSLLDLSPPLLPPPPSFALPPPSTLPWVALAFFTGMRVC